MTTSGSATMSRTRMRGLSDDQGSWNTAWTVVRYSLQGVAVERMDVLAVDEHVAGGRLLQAQDELGRRRLAAAGLAHEGQRLALRGSRS